MQYKTIRKSDSVVRKIADTYSATNYITKDISPNVSLAVNFANGHLEEEVADYDRIYYVIEGEIEFIFDNQKVLVQNGDSIFITKNTRYVFSGTFEAVVVNQPAFGS